MHHMVTSWLLIHLIVTQHALLTLAHHSLRETAIIDFLIYTKYRPGIEIRILLIKKVMIEQRSDTINR